MRKIIFKAKDAQYGNEFEIELAESNNKRFLHFIDNNEKSRQIFEIKKSDLLDLAKAITNHFDE